MTAAFRIRVAQQQAGTALRYIQQQRAVQRKHRV